MIDAHFGHSGGYGSNNSDACRMVLTDYATNVQGTSIHGMSRLKLCAWPAPLCVRNISKSYPRLNAPMSCMQIIHRTQSMFEHKTSTQALCRSHTIDFAPLVAWGVSLSIICIPVHESKHGQHSKVDPRLSDHHRMCLCACIRIDRRGQSECQSCLACTPYCAG